MALRRGAPQMRLVVIESPFAGDRVRNHAYLGDAVLDCLSRGESPYASHLVFPPFLDDNDPKQRALGIAAGLAWGTKADATVVYQDLGISGGMKLGIEAAQKAGRSVEYRSLAGKWAGQS
jgi:hypothetical protein